MKQMVGFMALAIGVAMLGSVGCSSSRVIQVQNTPGMTVADTPNLIIEDRSFVNVNVQTTTVDDNGKAMAGKMITAIEGQLATDGYGVYLANTKSPDVVIAMEITDSVFDKSGEYYVVDAAIPRIETYIVKNDKKLINAESIPSVRSDRLLGESAAFNSAAQKLIPAVKKFVSNNVSLEKMGIQASVIELLIRNPSTEALVYMDKFTKAISKMDGVLRCGIVAGDAETAVWKLRVVYENRFYPNTISAEIIRLYGKKFDLDLSDRGIY